MEYLIYGFELDIRWYNIWELTLWLLVVCLIHIVTGAYIHKHNICSEYFILIRTGRFSRWWYQLFARVMALNAVMIFVVFALSTGVQLGVWKLTVSQVVGRPMLQAFVLHLLNFCFLSSIQMIMIHHEIWEKWAFFLMVFIEVLSLYMGVVWIYKACWLPGSWKMFRRSSLYFDRGFPVVAVTVFQVVVIGACWLRGWCIFKGRKHPRCT